jgi:hypothetical protein
MKSTQSGGDAVSKKGGRGRAAGLSKQGSGRILVGVRLEERLVKVMKGLAELKDFTLGELIEEVFMVAMDGGNAFADRSGKVPADMRQRIVGLKQVYGVDYDVDELLAGRGNRPQANE